MADGRLRTLAVVLSALLHGLLLVTFADSMLAERAAVAPITVPTRVTLNFRDAPEPPEPEPEPIPEPEPEPAPEPEPEPVPEPEPEKPEPKPEPEPKPKPKPKAKAKPKPKPKAAEPQTPQAAVARPPDVDPEQLKAAYLARLLAHIESYKRYPRAARRRNVEGKVRIRLRVLRDGRIEGLKMQGGHKMLRKAARKAVEAALPLPTVAEGIDFPLVVTYAMEYSLN